ncbi:uncharacterized protein BDZ99DRAFT_85047 [Mytilinidion resinicola]|uniref:Uncharacterized protein n=1 Tax=Mytilinidion resinicola TaxID=574789 RepID=A0A6A6YD62_9PEZI|nr:uncharacterized protein BDZ99DRAFT_85047 [Mytilinidion resinicola]KAF2806761.1 hypothetical protein BDZ99DRAFT_85047 [Mytilinidion resinicola]
MPTATTTNVLDLTTDNEIKPELLNAIESVKASTLRSVLMQLCQKSTICASNLEEIMLVPDPQLQSTTTNGSATNGSKKRKLETKTSRYARCVQCKEDYDIVLNEQSGEEQSCRRHEGVLEMNEDAFPDDDDVQYYGHKIDVETDWRVDEFPEDFTWTCCGQHGKEAEPCLRSRHCKSKTGEGRGKVFRLVDGDFPAGDGDESESE